MGTTSRNPEHLPRRLQELREAMGLSTVNPWLVSVESGGNCIGRIKGSFICPTMDEPPDYQTNMRRCHAGHPRCSAVRYSNGVASDMRLNCWPKRETSR